MAYELDNVATPGTVLIANPGADLYGSDRMLLETVTALRHCGHRVVVTLPAAGPLESEIVDRGGDVQLCATPVIRKSMLHPGGLVQLGVEVLRSVRPSLTLIREVDPELIFVNTITTPLWLVLAKFARRPAICHVHEGEASAPGVLRKAINLPLLLADRLIVNSEFSRGVLVDALPSLATRAEVVYNSVPGPSLFVEPRSELSGSWRILFVGRLSPRKGPDVAIEALAVLRRHGIDATLDLVGAVFPGYEWFERELRHRVEELGLTRVIHFHGFRRDAWSFTAGCDVIVVPSTIDEPFGNTAVEALLSGRPVVVSSVGGLPEAVAGFTAATTVTPGDPEALATAIEEIGSRWPEFRLAAIRDSVKAAQQYSATSYAEQILGAVDVVLAARDRTSELLSLGHRRRRLARQRTSLPPN